MEDHSVLIQILQNVALPIVTAVIGWFAKVFRDRQKKEKDILANVEQILGIQKKFIEEQSIANEEMTKTNKRLEAKLDRKNKAIRKANWCKYTNEGDGCPVLVEEEKHDGYATACENCKYNQEEDAKVQN